MGRRARVVRRGRLWVIPNGLADVPPSCAGGTRVGGPGARDGRPVRSAQAPARADRRDGDAPARRLDADVRRRRPDSSTTAATTARRLLGDRVSFLGHRDDVPQVLAAHDVIVLWSAYEGMPISLLEGMRAGLCCVASDLPGVRVLFGTPPAGLVAGSPGELAAAIDQLVGDVGRRAELGARARCPVRSSLLGDGDGTGGGRRLRRPARPVTPLSGRHRRAGGGASSR